MKNPLIASNQENNTNLNSFFEEEYSSLRRYIQSRINQTSESDAEDIIQEVDLRIFSWPLDALPFNNIGDFVYGTIKTKLQM